MPKRLSHEQVEALEANGAIAPHEEQKSDPGAVLRALGSTGLPHSEEVDTMFTPEEDYSDESEINRRMRLSLTAAHTATTKLMQKYSNATPRMDYPEMIIQTEQAKRTFVMYATLGLDPEFVITPVGKPLNFWYDLFELAQSDDALNYNDCLQGGGLDTGDLIVNSWEPLTDRSGSFAVEIVSGLDKPYITGVTAFGYRDFANHIRSGSLNTLLSRLKMSLLPSRTADEPSIPSQSEILPYTDTYLMQQLTRIINGKNPVDATTESWLWGLTNTDDAVSGGWSENAGHVVITYGPLGIHGDQYGIRPSGSGLNA